MLVFMAAALGFVVAEPRGDLVAGALEESAIVIAAATFARPFATLVAVVGPSGAFITRGIPRVVTVISHISSSRGLRGEPGETGVKNERCPIAVPD